MDLLVILWTLTEFDSVLQPYDQKSQIAPDQTKLTPLTSEGVIWCPWPSMIKLSQELVHECYGLLLQ